MTKEELAKAIREDYERKGIWAIKTTTFTMKLDFEMLGIILEALEEPKGRWVENDRGIPICSCCGKYKYEDIDGSIYDDVWFPNYCPNCGAKMIEPKERSCEG